MAKIQEQLHSIQTQQGVLFSDLLVVQKYWGDCTLFLIYNTKLTLHRFGSGDMQFV